MSNRKAHKKLEERIERLVREFEDATGEEVRDLGRPRHQYPPGDWEYGPVWVMLKSESKE